MIHDWSPNHVTNVGARQDGEILVRSWRMVAKA
jgi:hypothetical protein